MIIYIVFKINVKLFLRKKKDIKITMQEEGSKRAYYIYKYTLKH